MVDNARDRTAPVIEILSPAEYAAYSRVISITGRVNDSAGAGIPGRVRSLSYEILSHSAAKEASLAGDGSFSIAEPNDIKENIVVLLHAEDWNGNASDYRLPLTWPGSEIPSFKSLEGNRQTTLSWDPVPGVQSYTLYMESSGIAPDPATSASVAGVSSPYTVSKLDNGKVYSFLLVGSTAEGKMNYSPVLRSIPLSRFDLLPSARSAFNSIELSWRAHPGIGVYEVLRASAAEGPYQSVSGAVAGGSWRDQGVVQGLTYYYEVRPAQYSAVASWYTEASPDQLPGRSDAYIGDIEGASYPANAAWSEGRLYVADFYYGLRIYDVSQPSSPRLLSSLALSSAKDVAVQGSYAYVSASKNSKKGLFVIDLSNPASPAVAGFAEVPDAGGLQSEGLAVDGDMVVLAGFNDGFSLIDVTDRANPQVRLSNQDKASLGQNFGAALQDRSGTKVLAVFGLSQTNLYTISGSPAAPTLGFMSAIPRDGRDGNFDAVTENLVFASGWNLEIWGTSNPASPSNLASLALTASVAAVESVALAGTRAYASLRGYGFSIVDLSNPSAPAILSTLTVPGSSEGIAEGGGYAYLCGGNANPISVYGVGDTTGITVMKTPNTLAAGASLAAWRDTLYVTDYYATGGYYEAYPSLYSAASPPTLTAPTTSISPSYSPFAYAFAGDWAVIAAERSGVALWNVAVPGTPAPQGTYYNIPGGNAWSVAITGPYAFIGTANSWLVTMDLSRDGSASVSASVQTQAISGANYEVRDVALRSDGLAFVANELAGLRVVDISDPTYPIALPAQGFATAGYASAEAVALSGDFALVADSGSGATGGFLVFDASSARTWSGAVLPIWSSTGPAYDVAVSGSHAYVARGGAGLEIWDISNPRSPVRSGSIGGFAPMKIVVYKGALYALDGADGIYAVDLTP